MENIPYGDCPPPTSTRGSNEQIEQYTVLLDQYCLCQTLAVAPQTKAFNSTTFERNLAKSPNIDLFNLFKTDECTANANQNFTFTNEKNMQSQCANQPSSNLENFPITNIAKLSNIISETDLVQGKSPMPERAGKPMYSPSYFPIKYDTMIENAQARTSKSEELKNEMSFINGKEKEAQKQLIQKSHNIDLNDDEEWTYTPPKYYNVKESSVAALESYKYVTLYKHNKRTNRTVRYFVCQYTGCDKKFNKSWNFIDHMRMHNGEKPYSCNECGKEFTQKGNFNKHCRIHSSDS
jgi:hypothetical protein